MTKGSVEKEHIFVNIRASKYVKQIFMHVTREIDNTVIVGCFNLD